MKKRSQFRQFRRTSKLTPIKQTKAGGISKMKIFNKSSKCRTSNPRHGNDFQFKAPRGRFTEIRHSLKRKKHLKINQGSNIVRGSFGSRDNVRILVQFRSERQSQYLFFH